MFNTKMLFTQLFVKLSNLTNCIIELEIELHTSMLIKGISKPDGIHNKLLLNSETKLNVR